MREVFQRHLWPLGDEAYQIRECRISRYRPRHHGERYILLYTLRIKESGTEHERIQLVSGGLHEESGRTKREWEELQQTTPDPSMAFEPFSYIPELEMLVQVFPYDRRLPSLPLLMEGPYPELEPLLLARFGADEWRTEVWYVEPVRYLPETRATLRITVRAREEATGRVEERRFYAKVYHEEKKGEQAHRVLRALWDKASADGEDFTVGRPITYLGDLRTLIQEETPGISLHDILLGRDAATPAVRKAARALATLHLEPLAGVATSRRPRTWREKEVATLEKRGEALRRACPNLGPEIEKIVDAVVADLKEEETPTAPTHGELKPDHILLDGDRPAVIDLDAFSEADPLLAVAGLLSLIRIMPLRTSLKSTRGRLRASLSRNISLASRRPGARGSLSTMPAPFSEERRGWPTAGSQDGCSGRLKPWSRRPRTPWQARSGDEKKRDRLFSKSRSGQTPGCAPVLSRSKFTTRCRIRGLETNS